MIDTNRITTVEEFYEVGVTATRLGLTPPQAEYLTAVLASGRVRVIRHGDCVGGDADADRIASALDVPRVAHPPTNPALRAYRPADVVMPPEPYTARNRAIVLATCPLLAFPAQARERSHGGTWGTVRYARTLGRPLALCLPCGRVTLERWRALPDWSGDLVTRGAA